MKKEKNSETRSTLERERERRSLKNNKKKIIIGVAIVLVLLIIAIILWINFNSEEEAVTLSTEEYNVDTGDWENVSIVTDTSMGYTIYVPIPEGYVASSVVGETTVKEGLVIYEGDTQVTDSNVSSAKTSRNQYVWIPVNAEEMYGTDSNGKKWSKLYDYSSSGRSAKWSETNGVINVTTSTTYREPDIVTERDNDYYLTRYTEAYETGHDLLADLEIEFEEMIASVEKYGGFYIGRYETGSLSEDTPVVVKGNSDISSQTWYTMYERCKNINSSTEGITTSMIFDCQWDAVLEFLVESGDKTYEEVGTNSTSWGNYSNSTGDAATGSGSKRPTGYNEAWSACNIYDMAGNVRDWTIEAYSTGYRVSRGGNYNNSGSSGPAGSRNGYDPYGSNTYYGCRSVLWIK